MIEGEGTDWIQKARSLTLGVRNFVNGRWSAPKGKGFFDKYAPRDGRKLYELGISEQPEVDEAVASGREAFRDGRWSNTTLRSRKEVLHKLAGLIDQHRNELALLESVDVGKPISDALSFDVPTAAATIRYCAEAADKISGKVYEADLTSLSYELRRPLGVAAAVVGWNFPLLLAAQKIGPALATGNSLILKPSEVTSLSAARIAELAMEAGVPEGVLNVIHGGASTGAALARHPNIDLLTFTGSTRTGKELMVAAGRSNMKRLILECGGKAPNIVFDDCPSLESVATGIVESAFWNQGQVCVASSRLLVQEEVCDELTKLLVKGASNVKPGDPLSIDTTFGALVSASHKKKVLGYIENGETGGATIVHQGNSAPPFDEGFYVPPTMFGNVTSGQRIAQEEIFGPVLCIIPFRNEDDAIRIANGTIYGLSAILWTKDMGRAHRITHALQAGSITVNATGKPRGGPAIGVLSSGGLKESGIGVEGGIDGLRAYTSQTAVQYFV